MDGRKRQIEDAASTLFSARGYSATSVRDIARALDMQGGSLYAHISSKEDVLWNIVNRAAERFHAAVRPIANGTECAAERLRGMARAHVRVITDDIEHATVFLHEWRFLGPERRAAIARQRDAYEAYFRAVIAEGMVSGEFRRVDPKMAGLGILSGLNGIAQWYRPHGPLAPDAIADAFADLFLCGLCRPQLDETK
ncbi:MAG: TetR/AcrR family transcriptional regulator [Thermomicrobia bacterium]|nr:TetR/AcrR family transcriptional regulator [Thermomicrobia bacterium]MCA1724665.1 TetR/AcrR family transcriptional regulator [Thermomicrobia bacterium]